MPRPLHPHCLDHSNYTWRRVQVTKLLIMQFSPTSCHFIPLWSKYSPRHPVLKYVSPLRSETKFHIRTKPRSKLYYHLLKLEGTVSAYDLTANK
jgi:hypothetical protein